MALTFVQSATQSGVRVHLLARAASGEQWKDRNTEVPLPFMMRLQTHRDHVTGAEPRSRAVACLAVAGTNQANTNSFTSFIATFICIKTESYLIT